MRTLLFILVFLSPPALKPALLRWLGGAQIGRHVHIGWFASLAGRSIVLGDYSEIRALTLIQCDGDLRIGAYSIVSSFNLVYGCAGLIVGDHAYIGPQSLINCDEDVRLGSHSALGARSMIYTHGSYLPFTEGYPVRFGGVTIGDYTWCAAGVFIHPGITIGSNVFVNSRSVVAQDIGDGEVCEGFPARQVTTIDRVRRTMTPRRLDAAAAQMVDHFAEMVLRRQLQLQPQQLRPGQVRVSAGGRSYLIAAIPSAGAEPEPGDAQLVALVNRPGWQGPAGALRLDLASMRTPYPRDLIHRQLDLFMRRYYGVQFRYDEPGNGIVTNAAKRVS